MHSSTNTNTKTNTNTNASTKTNTTKTNPEISVASAGAPWPPGAKRPGSDQREGEAGVTRAGQTSTQNQENLKCVCRARSRTGREMEPTPRQPVLLWGGDTSRCNIDFANSPRRCQSPAAFQRGTGLPCKLVRGEGGPPLCAKQLSPKSAHPE